MNEREEVALRNIIWKYTTPLDIPSAPKVNPRDLVGLSLEEAITQAVVDDMRIFSPAGLDLMIEELHKHYNGGVDNSTGQNMTT